MHDDREMVEERIRRVLRERIRPAVHGPSLPLRVEAFVVPGEPIPYAEAVGATYQPFAVGSPWGTPWGTTWFRMVGEVPDEWSGGRVEALIDFGASTGPGFSVEALVWNDGGPAGGLHPDHKAVLIGNPVAGGEAVDLLIEAASNPSLVSSYQPSPMGDPKTAPEVPLYRLARAELAVRNDDVYHLVLDMQTLTRLMVQLPTNEPRRNLILRAVERALDRLDLHDVPSTAVAARAELADTLARPAHASAHHISAAGHAHIDTAWLWPLRETKRKCARTFSTAVALMDEYPEYLFVCSQAQQFAWMRDEYPQLWERIKARVADGRFVPTGSMWVEADCNIPSGESLARQFIHGKRFFRDELGVETTDVWIPDVFGYSGQLPQLMDLAGCRWFLTQKLSWNETNRFPHHTFWWEGIDGTRIFTHFPPVETYNGSFHANELARAVHGFADHGRANRSFYPFGHGDGGGGPTREMLELARRQADLEGSPLISIETPEAFFEQARADYPDAAVWRGELYFEKHRGTYTSQAKTKWGNRRGELLLREAELWSALAAREVGFEYPYDEFDAWWKVLLLHQFHDIIPGSSIAWVHDDTEADHARLHAGVEAIIDRALDTLADRLAAIVLTNASTHDRSGVVMVDPSFDPGGDDLVAVDGDIESPAQRLADGRVAFHATVPGLGASSITLRAGSTEFHNGCEVLGDRVLENGLVRVELDDAGHLISLTDKFMAMVSGGAMHATEGERLAGPANVLQLFADHPNQYDAWDVDAASLRTHTVLDQVDALEVVERGPVVAAIRVTRTFGASRIVQTISITRGSPRVDIDTEVDWHENEKLLKVAFPLAVRADEASYEIQFGHVRRPTHTNTSWDAAKFEVCGHKWADLSEPGFGVALLNDCKYGFDCVGNVLRMTLLRAPNYPDPDCDRGHHTFRYSLLPHRGSIIDGRVADEALDFNLPVRSVAGRGERTSMRLLPRSHRRGVVLEAAKLADDRSGDLVLRCYEAYGTTEKLPFALEATVTDCDLHEQPRDGELDPTSIPFTPFQIRTLRLS